MVGWEDAVPGVSDEAQAVINNQILQDFDVFVGIFWHRIGTPTNNSQSGTVEEYKIALRKFQKDQKQDDILVYFKGLPVSTFEIDGDQFKALQDFRQQLDNDGVLYGKFTDGDQFNGLMDSHLTKLAKKHGPNGGPAVGGAKKDRKKKPARAKSKKRSSDGDDEISGDSELGFLDHVERFSSASDKIVPLVGELASKIAKVGKATRSGTAKLEKLPAEASVAVRKKILREVAGSMNECSDTFETERDKMKRIYEDMTASTKGMIETAGDFPDAELGELVETQESLIKLHSSMTDSADELTIFSNELRQIPRVEKNLNVAKRRLSALLDEFANTTLSASSLFDESVNELDRLLNRGGDRKATKL